MYKELTAESRGSPPPHKKKEPSLDEYPQGQIGPEWSSPSCF